MFRPYQFDVLFHEYAYSILVGVVSKEHMCIYILTPVIEIHAGLVELALVRYVGTVRLCVVCGT